MKMSPKWGQNLKKPPSQTKSARVKPKGSVTLEKGHLGLFRYPTRDNGTYLGRGVTIHILSQIISSFKSCFPHSFEQLFSSSTVIPCYKNIKSSKTRSPRRAGGILAQGRSLVNRASSLSSSRCHGLHWPGEPAAIWPNLRAWSTGPPHLPLQSAILPPMPTF